jgi:hypothetical protein
MMCAGPAHSSGLTSFDIVQVAKLKKNSNISQEFGLHHIVIIFA